MTVVAAGVLTGEIIVGLNAETFIAAGGLFVESNIVALNGGVALFTGFFGVRATGLNNETVRSAIRIGKGVGLTSGADEYVIIVEEAPSAGFFVLIIADLLGTMTTNFVGVRVAIGFGDGAAVVGLETLDGVGETINVIGATGITLTALKGRKSDENHHNDDAGDGEHQGDFDDGEARLKKILTLFHWFPFFLL